MKRARKSNPERATVSPAVAKRVAAAAERVGLTREQALAIARAEPRGATIFAGPIAPKGPAHAGRTRNSPPAGRKSD